MVRSVPTSSNMLPARGADLRARGPGRHATRSPGVFATLLLTLTLTALAATARAQTAATSAQAARAPGREAALAEATELAERVTSLYATGAYAEATPLAERVVTLRERALGKGHPDVATALNELAVLYVAQGAYPRAETLLVRALALLEKARGKGHPDVASCLSNIAKIYAANGAYEKAVPLAQRALTIWETSRGSEHPDVAMGSNSLAEIYREQGAYTKAEPLYTRAISIYEKASGAEHPDLAAPLNNLALLYVGTGAYGEAEPLAQRALAILEKARGPAHPEVATALTTLAGIHQHRGANAKAEPLLVRALSIAEASLGPEHPDLSYVLNNLAYLYVEQGSYAKAEPIYRRALNLNEHALGQDHPSVALVLTNIAWLYLYEHASEKAEAPCRRSLTIYERALGPEHPQVVTSLNCLAEVRLNRGAYAEAEPFLQRSFAVLSKALGPAHPSLTSAIDGLTQVYAAQGAGAKAEAWARKGLAIRERALGPDHPEVALSLTHIGNALRGRGAYAEAEASFDRAMSIWQRAYGAEHPGTAILHGSAALLAQTRVDLSRTREHLERAASIHEHNLGTELGAGAEARKRAFLSNLRSDTDWCVSFHVNTAPGDGEALRLALTTSLRRKGRVLDELVGANQALRRNLTPALHAEFDALGERRAELAARRNEPYDPQRADALRTLAEEVDRREAELATKSAAFRVQTEPLTVERVQATLPADATLVEFARYRRFDPKGAILWHEARYVAYVLRREGPPRFVDLGEAASIEAAALAARRALADRSLDAREPLRALDALVLAPVRRLAGEPAHLLLSPDGPLHLVPFEAFVDEQGRYLLERSTVTYLTSGRDLLRLSDRPPARSAPLVVAAPDFGPGDWSPLPGTAAEAEALRKYFPAATVVTGEAATKEAFLRAQAPRFVHAATHGLFARRAAHTPSSNVVVPPASRGLRVLTLAPPPVDSFAPEDALDDSALLFAGANTKPDARLTAREAAGLDLAGTELVVLSACETGLGELGGSEGVYGLRRALSVAGAASQVASLWNVNDNATGALMGAYYGELKAGIGRSEALRRAQLGLLRQDKFKHPFYWAAFVPAGDWRPLGGDAAVPTQPRSAACETRAAGAHGNPPLIACVLAGLALSARRTRRAPSSDRVSTSKT